VTTAGVNPCPLILTSARLPVRCREISHAFSSQQERTRPRASRSPSPPPPPPCPTKTTAAAVFLACTAPGKSDLEILNNLKSIIKDGQHEFYRAFPQPAALASIHTGHIPQGQTHLDQTGIPAPVSLLALLSTMARCTVSLSEIHSRTHPCLRLDDRGMHATPLAADDRPRANITLEERLLHPAPIPSLQDHLSQPASAVSPARVDIAPAPSLEGRLSSGPVPPRAYPRSVSIAGGDLHAPPPKDDLRDHDRITNFRTNRDFSRERPGGPLPTASTY